MVGPPLELSGRAAVIRAVFNLAVRDGGPTSCHATDRARVRAAAAPALHDINGFRCLRDQLV